MAKLIVIAAPSGGGKTTLIRTLLKDLKDSKLSLSTSFTTRKKRSNEKEGESYFFIDKKEFERKKENNDFLEKAEVFGNLYGTSKSWVEEQLDRGINVLLELDWQGAIQVKSKYPNSITIFIIPPSYQELETRLNERNQDKPEIIEYRLLEAKKEIQQGNNFDFLIVNDIFEDALKDLKTVILGNGHIPKERQSIAKECVSGLLEL